MDFTFLKSTRFWAVILGTISVYLKAKGIFGEAEMMLIASITGLFTTIRTIDRATEYLSGKKLP